MTPMVKRLPDDLFRRRTPASGQARETVDSVETAVEAAGGARVKRGEGVETRLLVLLLALAIVTGFFGGKILLLRLDPAGPAAEPSRGASAPAVSGQDHEYTPYEGTVVGVIPDSAIGRCPEGRTSGAPQGLIDTADDSIWRCGGDGAGVMARFSFDSGATLAGFRLVNGNTVWPDRYSVERRITAVRWTFDDGSFLVQGLAPNNSKAQEVRFPPTATGSVRMEIISATPPSDGSAMADAVSLSAVQFLEPQSS